MELQQNELESVISPLKKVTPLSKYLAMTLFIIIPFLGGYIGYTLAPEKVVEVERINDKYSPAIESDNQIISLDDKTLNNNTQQDLENISVVVDKLNYTMLFSSASGFNMSVDYYPSEWYVDDFEGQVTSGSDYKVLARINNPKTPGMPDTDSPREFFMASVVKRECEGVSTEISKRLTVYDTGWIDSGFIENASTRTLCVAGNSSSLQLYFNPLFEEGKLEMDKIIGQIFFN